MAQVHLENKNVNSDKEEDGMTKKLSCLEQSLLNEVNLDNNQKKVDEDLEKNPLKSKIKYYLIIIWLTEATYQFGFHVYLFIPFLLTLSNSYNFNWDGSQQSALKQAAL